MSMYKTLDLERLTFAAQQIVSERLAEEFAIAPRVQIEREMFGDIAITVRQSVLAQHLDRRIVRYPATWKEAFKEWFYPRAWSHWPWGIEAAQRRWPVQYHEVTIDVKALYPKIGLHGERSILTVMRDERTPPIREIDDRPVTLDDLHLMYYGATITQTSHWRVGRKVYMDLVQLRYPDGRYLWMGQEDSQTLLGLSVVIDEHEPFALRIEG